LVGRLRGEWGRGVEQGGRGTGGRGGGGGVGRGGGGYRGLLRQNLPEWAIPYLLIAGRNCNSSGGEKEKFYNSNRRPAIREKVWKLHRPRNCQNKRMIYSWERKEGNPKDK